MIHSYLPVLSSLFGGLCLAFLTHRMPDATALTVWRNQQAATAPNRKRSCSPCVPKATVYRSSSAEMISPICPLYCGLDVPAIVTLVLHGSSTFSGFSETMPLS